MPPAHPQPMRLAARAAEVLPSATLAMTARAQAMIAAGQDVLSMTAGEPDFPTPANVCRAAEAAIARGETRYTPVAGTQALRRAVAAAVQRLYGRRPDPQEVIVGTGGKQILFNAVAALVDPGDEVICPLPYWVSYPDMVRLFGGRTVFVPPSRGALPLAADLAPHLGPKTRVLLLNSPQNPTGAAYSHAELVDIAALLARHPHVWAISDDIYAGLVYDGPFVGLASLAPDLADRLLVVGGVSKSYAMTGWRIGYGVGPRPLVAAMEAVQGAATSGACSVAQAAAVEALIGSQAAAESMRQAFAHRRDLMVAALAEVPRLPFVRPAGAFYVLVDVAAYLGGQVADATALCEWLLAKEGLATVPGAAFGAPHHLRLSFAMEEGRLRDGVARLARGLARLA